MSANVTSKGRGELLLGALCSFALLAALPASALAARRPQPVVSGAGKRVVAVHGHYRVITGHRRALAMRFVAKQSCAGWYSVGGGESIRVSVSDTYMCDTSITQTYATFLGALWHARGELSKLSVVLLSSEELSQICGENALACYSPDDDMEFIVPETGTSGVSIATNVAHEFGHFVADHRRNDPWPAAIWGPKRWASYVNVCSLVARGVAYPGNEGAHYAQNPGEGWAVAYAYANGQQWTDNVDRYWHPDSAAEISAIKLDAQSPWPGNSILNIRNTRVTRTNYTLNAPMPYDGTLNLQLTRAPASYRIALYIGGRRYAMGRNVRITICGGRQWRIVVDRRGRRGTFTLRMTSPLINPVLRNVTPTVQRLQAVSG